MPKRFTDTDIWKKQRWFRKLPPLYKLAFYYIKDQCHHSGIWQIDCTDLIEDLGIENFDILKFIDAVNIEFDKFSGEKISKERMRIINNTYLWITGFIQYQYENKAGKVSPEAAPVKTAIEHLEGLGILNEALNKGYITLAYPLQEGYIRAKDKDIDIDKDIVKEDKGVKGEKGEQEKAIYGKPDEIRTPEQWESEKKSFLNNGKWIYTFCTEKKITVEKFDELATEWVADIGLKEDLKSAKELRNHFTNWYNKNFKLNGTAHKAATNGNSRPASTGNTNGNKFTTGAEKLLRKGQEHYASVTREQGY